MYFIEQTVVGPTGPEIGWIRVSKSVRIRHHIRIGHDDSVKFSQQSKLCCNTSVWHPVAFSCVGLQWRYIDTAEEGSCAKLICWTLCEFKRWSCFIIRKQMLCASSLINYIGDLAVVGLRVWWCNRRSHIVVLLERRTHQTSSAAYR